MHYAVHGHTAAELIVERANAEKEYMGFDYLGNKIVKPDVSIAKNYLKQVDKFNSSLPFDDDKN